LEESLGTVDSTRAVYDRILELKIANPQIIVNYANFLEENKFFEDSYKVYERGIDLFGYPIAFELWNIYLVKFIERYVSICLAPIALTSFLYNSLQKLPLTPHLLLFMMLKGRNKTGTC
jgi:hypothetical protein